MKLSKALAACQLVQRTYGKQAGDLDKVAEIFSRVLAEYEPQTVIQAVKQWITQSQEFPTPSDIAKLLNTKPVYEREVYIAFCQQAQRGEVGEYKNRAAYDYIKAYEQQALEKVKNGK